MKMKSEREVAQSYPTLRDPMDCSLPGSSIHGIFQARVLEWVAIAFSNKKSKKKHANDMLKKKRKCNHIKYPIKITKDREIIEDNIDH